MDKKRHYNIVEANTLVELEAKVNGLLEAGFMPIGGPLSITATTYSTTKSGFENYIYTNTFAQALYFHEEKP